MIKKYYSIFFKNLNLFYIFFSILLIFFTSIYFPYVNYFSLFLIFFSFFLYLLRDISKYSDFLYKFFLISLFIKLFLISFLYLVGLNFGYEFGDFATSDTISYFKGSRLLLDVHLHSEIFLPIFGHEKSYAVYYIYLKDISFYLYNAILRFISPEITLQQISSLNIFFSTFSSIFFFRILKGLGVDKKIVIIGTILSLIDLKLIFFSLFNFKETLINFFLIYITYSLIRFKRYSDGLIQFCSILIIISSFLIILLLREYLAFSLLVILITFFILEIFKPRINLSFNFLYSFILISILYILFCVFFVEDSLILKESLIQDYENSIGSKILNLNIIYNPFNLFIQLASGIIGIFPLFNFYTHFMELEKFALVYSHLLFISSFFGFCQIIKKKILDKKFLISFTFLCLILFFSTIGSLGSLSFIRYFIHAEYVLIYFASFYFLDQKFLKLRKVVFIYLIIQIILIVTYKLTKYFLI